MASQTLPERGPAGFLNVHKPLHMTSHDVVAVLRRRYRALYRGKKVGHAGTLDPLADGVLVICLGAATRLSQYMMRSRKLYRAQITFGIRTSSYDAAGTILEEQDCGRLQLADIERQLPQFMGEIQQLPPMFSAIKVGGKKLYELARAGIEIERAARPVRIDSIDILQWQPPSLTLQITCGPGTYIRSLAHDLGEALSVGAHLSGLTRFASGDFHLHDSLALDILLQQDDWEALIVRPYAALRQEPCIVLSAREAQALQHGQCIARKDEQQAETAFAFDAQQRLVAIVQRRRQQWKPQKVFPYLD